MAQSEVKIVLTVAGTQQAKAALQQVEQSTDALTSAVRKVGHYGASAFAVHYVVQYAKALYEASAAGQRLATTLQFAGGGARDLAFLRNVTERLGIGFQDAAEAFAGFSAAARGTSLAGAGAREVFESIAKASAVMGLSAGDTRGVLLALQQMISKGTVSAEELRGQLGERLPGAFQIAARAMGVTTQELGKMLERGEILATDFLPRFARALNEELGGAAESASQRLDASTARMGNAMQRLAQTIGDSGVSQSLAWAANAATEELNAMSDAMQGAANNGGGFFSQLSALLGSRIAGMPGPAGVAATLLRAGTYQGGPKGDAGRGDGSIQLAAYARERELAEAAKRLEDSRVSFMASYRDNGEKLAAAIAEYREKFAGKISADQQRIDEAAIRKRFAVTGTAKAVPGYGPGQGRVDAASDFMRSEKAAYDEVSKLARDHYIELFDLDHKRLESARDLNASIVELNASAGEEILARQKANAEAASQALSDSIAEGLLEGFRNGETLADVFLRELKAQFAKTILSPIIKPVVDQGNQAISGLLNLAASYIFGGSGGMSPGGFNANGTPFNNISAYVPPGRAAGGPVLAGSTYLIGERGPELLRMGAMGGQVIPNSQGGGRPVTLNVINNGAPATARTSQRETPTGTVIDLVLDAVARDIQSGGRVHDAAQRRFGLSSGGTTPRY